MLRYLLTTLLLITSITILTTATAQEHSPILPTAAFDKYTVTQSTETIETMKLTRFKITGRLNFIIDPLENYNSVPPTQLTSASFVKRRRESSRVDIISFNKSAFPYELNDATLNAYLDGLVKRSPTDQKFTIVEPSAFTEVGPARFRILGKRAMTVRYSYIQDQQRLVVAENWIVVDGTVLIVRIQGPETNFEQQYTQMKRTFNTLSLLE